MRHYVKGLEAVLPGEEQMAGLTASLSEEAEGWKKWASAEDPFPAELPGEWQERVKPFQRLLLMKPLGEENCMACWLTNAG